MRITDEMIAVVRAAELTPMPANYHGDDVIRVGLQAVAPLIIAQADAAQPVIKPGGVPDRYRSMARADAVTAVATLINAGRVLYGQDERSTPWPAQAFDLADMLAEYILTGERPPDVG